MTGLPDSLTAAIAQSRIATQAAIAAGCSRLQVEFLFPELKAMPIAQEFLPVFTELGLQFKVYFPDAGAAALARRDWGNPEFVVRGITEPKGEMVSEDEAFLIVEPSAVEVKAVEALYDAAGDRPFVMLNPKLEDVAIVGIGYAARQIRDRFLSTIETAYSVRPLPGAAVFRCYPQPWQVWLERSPGQYEVIAETPTRPVGEELEQLLLDATGSSASADDAAAPARAKRGLLAELQQFLRALSQ